MNRDLASIAERLGLLQVVRVAIAITALVAGGGALLPITAVYVACTTTGELVRRWTRVRALAAVGWLLLADGVYLAMVLARTGGAHSALVFLVYVHVVAVTLVVSYRSGLKVALWHALLLFVLYAWRDANGAVSSHGGWPLVASSYLLVGVATAACSALNEGELRRGKSDLRALAAMATDLQGERGVDGVLHGLVNATRAATRVARAVAFAATDAHDAVVAESWSTRQPVLVAALDEERDPELAAALPGARNVIVVPLVVDGAPVGVLAAEWAGRRGATVPGRVVDLLSQLAAYAALAVRNAHLLGEVERLASTDSLTGLASRRVFEDALRREISRANRAHLPCAVVVLDVDRFKRVNDRHGHPVGDAVLVHVGRALATSSRAGDLPARYGGEEFAVVLPGCTAEEALTVAERLRTAIAAGDPPVPITASAGVAAFPEHAATADALVAAADRALYGAKRAGRNRARLAPPELAAEVGV